MRCPLPLRPLRRPSREGSRPLAANVEAASYQRGSSCVRYVGKKQKTKETRLIVPVGLHRVLVAPLGGAAREERDLRAGGELADQSQISLGVGRAPGIWPTGFLGLSR